MDFDEPCEKTRWFGPSIPNEKVTGELDGNWIIWDIATWASQRVKSSLVVFSTCMEKYKKIENCSIILGEETAFNRIKPSIVKVAPNMWI